MIKSHYSLFRLLGIPVRVHVTFLLFIGLVALVGARSLADVWGTLVLLVLVFAGVVLHELGHSLVARRAGVGVRDITLYPIGGVARLEGMPREPRVELRIAAAGPAVSLALGGLCWLASLPGGLLGPLLAVLAAVNLVLGLFNLLPGFPMDGGRILRALLATRLPYLRATRIASLTGQVVAGLFVAAGIILPQPMLALVGLFVFLQARTEYRVVAVREQLGRYPRWGPTAADFAPPGAVAGERGWIWVDGVGLVRPPGPDLPRSAPPRTFTLWLDGRPPS